MNLSTKCRLFFVLFPRSCRIPLVVEGEGHLVHKKHPVRTVGSKKQTSGTNYARQDQGADLSRLAGGAVVDGNGPPRENEAPEGVIHPPQNCQVDEGGHREHDTRRLRDWAAPRFMA